MDKYPYCCRQNLTVTPDVAQDASAGTPINTCNECSKHILLCGIHTSQNECNTSNLACEWKDGYCYNKQNFALFDSIPCSEYDDYVKNHPNYKNVECTDLSKEEAKYVRYLPDDLVYNSKKSSLIKQWWFWLIIILVVLMGAGVLVYMLRNLSKRRR